MGAKTKHVTKCQVLLKLENSNSYPISIMHQVSDCYWKNGPKLREIAMCIYMEI